MARELERVVITNKNVTYIVNPTFIPKEDITAEGMAQYFDLEAYQRDSHVLKQFSGRGNAYLIRDKYKQQIVLRHFWRGGFIAHILGDRYLACFESAKRAKDEFDLLLTMRKMGLPVPAPIAARMTKSGLFMRNDIILKEIPGARTIRKILAERRLTPMEIGKIGENIAKLFVAGIYHSDLNISNILIDGADNVWLIDFDKCFMKRISHSVREEVLDRLYRSFEKELEEQPAFQWCDSDWDKLEDAIKTAASHKEG